MSLRTALAVGLKVDAEALPPGLLAGHKAVAYRERVANLSKEIEEEAAVARKRTGTQPFGRATS